MVIYHCYGGAHSSVVAAAVHLGLLPFDRLPAPDEVWAVRYFDKQDAADHGRIREMGTDAAGNKVYVMGCRGQFKLLRRALREVARRMGVSADEEVLFVDTLGCVNWFMRIGGFLSRAVRVKWLGRPMVIYGTRKAYPYIRSLAEDTRLRCAERAGAGGRPPARETPGAGRRRETARQAKRRGQSETALQAKRRGQSETGKQPGPT